MEKLFDGGHFYEGVRWHEGSWYVSDLWGDDVHRVSSSGEGEVVVSLTQPSGNGWMPDGTMLTVAMTERKVYRRDASGELSVHADASGVVDTEMNDMVVDAQGGAYVGTFGFDLFAGAAPAEGQIVRIDPDGSARIAAEGLKFPNGMIITEDGGTLIAAESFGGRFAAFDIDADGSLSNHRVWAQPGREPSYESLETMLDTDFAPDGCAMDAEGHVWVADALSARACRIAPDGDIVEEIAAPEGHGLFSVTLGGDDGRSLLCCCAPSFARHERQAAKEAELWIHTVDVGKGTARP